MHSRRRHTYMSMKGQSICVDCCLNSLCAQGELRLCTEAWHPNEIAVAIIQHVSGLRGCSMRNQGVEWSGWRHNAKQRAKHACHISPKPQLTPMSCGSHERPIKRRQGIPAAQALFPANGHAQHVHGGVAASGLHIHLFSGVYAVNPCCTDC